jgi:putative nucleotidyltransferase with HDIG domain
MPLLDLQKEKRKKEIQRNLKNLKSVPASALQALKVLRDPNANMGEVVQIINYDPGLTSNILKLANSSYFGCARTIASLREAIVRLGSGTIFKIITASMASAVLNRELKGYDLKAGELWDHSVAVAVASENMSELLSLDTSKVAFTAGLLHDVGKIILCDFVQKHSAEIHAALENPDTGFDMAEKAALGFSHADIGGQLLQDWNIPDILVEPVKWHHNPAMCPLDNLPSVIHVCDWLCLENHIGTDHRPPNMKASPGTAVLKILSSLTRDILDETVARTKDSFDKIKDIFSKHI